MYKGEDNIPQQRLPLSKKTKEWKEECVEAFINISSHGTSGRKDFLKSLYDYYIDRKIYPTPALLLIYC